MQKIKNIIFDFGGVFYTIDYTKTENAFVDLGVKNFLELYNQQHASGLFELLETGKISPENFYNTLREIADIKASDEEIKNAWCAMLGYFPIERLQWLDEIRKQYNVFLFSNTNAIHINHFAKQFSAETGLENFDNFFIKAYYSHMLGLRKPHADAYLKVLQEQKLIAAETLFIDDTFSNIVGAQKAGLQTIHLRHPMTVMELDL
jgi:putative hydrolase of the HAD superfamily